jgi:hypothetical protein
MNSIGKKRDQKAENPTQISEYADFQSDKI